MLHLFYIYIKCIEAVADGGAGQQDYEEQSNGDAVVMADEKNERCKALLVYQLSIVL